MTERLQKIFSSRGVAQLGESADPDTDEILLEGSPLPSIQSNVYIMLHKPRGYVTTLSDEKGRPTVKELVNDCKVRVYPVGRLDMDSEGLLILTSDGAFANTMMHPKHNVDKVYEVWVTGFHEAATALLSRAITLDGYQIRKPEVKLLWSDGKKAKYLVTIHEGRNRQVRRMCEAAGMITTRLRRIAEGSIALGDLPLGKWRYLTEKEIAGLK